MSRIRVGVPPLLTYFPATWSSGKIWANVLRRLGQWCEVVVCDPGSESDARVDVWLWDGAQGPIDATRPVLVHIHEAPWDEPEVQATLDREFIARIDRNSSLALRQASSVLTGSESGKAQLVRRYGLDPSRVHVAPNGVDLDVYRPDGPTAAHLIDAAGGDGRRPYVLFVGGVLPRKNLPLLRRAMAELVRRGHPHDLVIVAGPALDRADSKHLLEEAAAPIAGRAVANLAGVSEEELASLMRGAAVLCLPSVTEGFGLPVVEAMACGTPAVVSDRGALPEVLGDGGIRVRPRLDALVDALAEVIGDPARRAALSRRAARRGAAFSWDRTARCFQRAIEATVRAAGESR